MNHLQLCLCLLAFVFINNSRADDEAARVTPKELVADRYRVKMVEFISGEEFKGLVMNLDLDSKLDQHARRFFVSGYIRAWIEYCDLIALTEGRGLGKVYILQQGVLRHEIEGWLMGCKAATEVGEVYKAQILEEIRRDLLK